MYCLVEEQIVYISKKLPFEVGTRKKIEKLAITLAHSYLSTLKEDEERFPSDVALSSVYVSSNKLGKEISQYQISKLSGFDLMRWPCIVSDINNRINKMPKR